MTDTPTPSIERLASCPFCGKQPREVPDDSYGAATVYCPDYNNCPVKPEADAILGAGETIADARLRWNTRAESATITALQSELAEMRSALAYVKAELLADPCPISRRHVRRRVDATLKDRPNTAKDGGGDARYNVCMSSICRNLEPHESGSADCDIQEKQP